MYLCCLVQLVCLEKSEVKWSAELVRLLFTSPRFFTLIFHYSRLDATCCREF